MEEILSQDTIKSDSVAVDALEFLTKELVLISSLGAKQRILDIGATAGQYTYLLSQLGHEIHILDRNGADIDRESGYAQIVTGSLESLPFGADSFDAIVCFGNALSHLPVDPEDQLRNLRRLLVPGGTLFVTVAARTAESDDFVRVLQQLEGSELIEALDELAETKRQQRGLGHDGTEDVVKYSYAETVDLLERSGFAVDESRVAGRHSALMNPFFDNVWDDPRNVAELLQYELAVGRLQWFQNHGDQHLCIARTPPS